MIPLKSSEHSAEIETSQVDQIFCQVPEILKFHETFLETLKSRLSYWDTKQKIGDVFVDVSKTCALYLVLRVGLTPTVNKTRLDKAYLRK
ncbi:hypothetical protein AVEN_229692-1 [Araneus ventricosus]|uniref:DH domain-containing protein n=1 Tax=Araneus ventricosus TaxID=182803 RepID=A0A4Y2IQ20_ARAVE|nr:hypothetical protein AVEN_229692-1 [Araneus ventricosus]